MVESTSRYAGIPIATTETAVGRTIVYLRRRFIPPPEQFALIAEHTVGDGERPDLVAHQYLGDSEQFWRLCDANNVQDPEDLTRPSGRRIRITLPAGIPGTPDA
jgi:hypothetical protein